ncbi:MAG: 4Fe-4S dicluster domain-containing protein [Deltaproteobacteria bacterium]|nr:4Fe-4S dicluster domain-containing protein [Deltaproteobacteria bacterium]
MISRQELLLLEAKARALGARLDRLDRRIREIRQDPGTRLSGAAVDRAKCIGCGACEAVCPVGAVSVKETAVVDAERCIGCGRCAEICPRGAIGLAPVSLKRRGGSMRMNEGAQKYRGFIPHRGVSRGIDRNRTKKPSGTIRKDPPGGSLNRFRRVKRSAPLCGGCDG